MTGWAFATGLGVTAAGWFLVANQAEVRRRRAAELEARRRRIAARVVESGILTRPWTDEHGFLHCPGCGGYVDAKAGVDGPRCDCWKRAVA